MRPAASARRYPRADLSLALTAKPTLEARTTGIGRIKDLPLAPKFRQLPLQFRRDSKMSNATLQEREN